jgi:putative ATP-binding cassette transporter
MQSDVSQLQPGAKVEGSDAWYMQIDFLFKALVVELVFVLIFVICFEYAILVSAERADAGAEPKAEDQAQRTDLSGMFRGMPDLMKPYYCSDAGWKGRAYCTMVITLGLAALALAFVHNTWQLEFWNLFQNPEKSSQGKFFHLMQMFSVLVVCFVLVDVYSQYCRQLLYIDWRGYMTQTFVQRWLANYAFYGVQLAGQVDNPDQRIQEDLSLFIHSSINVIWEFFSSLGHLILFVPLLLMYSPSRAFGIWYCPGWLLYLLAVYSLVGTLAAHWVGKRLIAINFAKQRTEADFRFALVEVRDHAESVALSGASDATRRRLGERFMSFRSTWWHFMQVSKRLTTFTRGFNMIKVLVPFFILSPSFFAGDLSMGRLFQLVHALGEVGQAFDWLIHAYAPLADWRATTDRLMMFEKAVQDNHIQPREFTPSDNVSVEDLALTLPSGKALWSLKKLLIPDGWVMITGPEGIGKTCLLRALAGVWPHMEGSVKKPQSGNVFVPQSPFFPEGLSLACALSYPLPPVDDARSLEEIRTVGLSEILEGKDVQMKADWMKSLSLGQRQRLVLGSLLVRDPPPRTVYLDEALSHLSTNGAVEMLGLLRRRLPHTNVIHVSHDLASLAPLHDTVLMASVDGKGQLHLTDVKHAYGDSGTGST